MTKTEQLSLPGMTAVIILTRFHVVSCNPHQRLKLCDVVSYSIAA